MAIDANRTVPPLTLGELAGKFGELCAGSALPVAAALVGLTAMYVANDQLVPLESQLRVQLPLGIIGFIVAYALTLTLLKASAAPGDAAPRPRFGAYFGLGFVSGVGILLGLVLLVVPGLILASRWMIATPMLLNEEATIGESLSESWHATANNWGKLIVAQIVVMAPLIAGMAVLFATAGEVDETVSLPVSIVSNVLLSMWSIGAVVLSVAAYRLIRPVSDGLADVFA